MATPKFRKSRANTHSRRSQWKADNVALQDVTIDGQTSVSRAAWLRLPSWAWLT